MTFENRARYTAKEPKLRLKGFLLPESTKGTKDWFGYLSIDEQDVKPLGEMLRNGDWTTDREGTRHLTLKISAWNRKSERGDWIKLLVGHSTTPGKIPSEVINESNKAGLKRLH